MLIHSEQLHHFHCVMAYPTSVLLVACINSLQYRTDMTVAVDWALKTNDLFAATQIDLVCIAIVGRKNAELLYKGTHAAEDGDFFYVFPLIHGGRFRQCLLDLLQLETMTSPTAQDHVNARGAFPSVGVTSWALPLWVCPTPRVYTHAQYWSRTHFKDPLRHFKRRPVT